MSLPVSQPWTALLYLLSRAIPSCFYSQDADACFLMLCIMVVFSSQTVLKMVYEESRKILALSEYPFGFSELKNVHQTRVVMEGCQKEGLTLLDAIQSLKDYLSKVADKGDKV